jgi:aspartate/methionine/tyrosine aminotransferase
LTVLGKAKKEKAMKSYKQLSPRERKALYEELALLHDEYKRRGLTLDLSRGKPNGSQLDVSNGLLTVDLTKSYSSRAGVDCRNYGLLDGLPEMKEFFAKAFGLKKEYITVGGNSSLQLMYDTLSRAMLFGVHGSVRPWSREEGVKWICVAPGYDRHFRITELLGFELLTVRMLPTGPDMDEVERLVRDPQVKGIWCVPKYSNPTGCTYSEETVRRLASMECAAPDFRIMWDNAYGIHDFTEDADTLADIFALAEKYGNEDRIFYYSSTSKVTYPGGGVAFMASSDNNRKQIAPYLGAQTIGYDKINQLRHLRFFGTPENMARHMLDLGGVIKAKFDVALAALAQLRGLGIAEWTEPRGGYFISLDVMKGTAKRVYELTASAGVTLTAVGATFPYGVDPDDSNLRLAPTYPTDVELSLACEILVLSIKLAALEKLGFEE